MPREALDHSERLLGFEVRATDGRIGVVVEASPDGLLVRRRRMLRSRVMIPARAIDRIDVNDRVVWLNRTRRDIAHIPRAKESEPGAWFVPASNRIAGGNPVIGVEPRRDPPP